MKVKTPPDDGWWIVNDSTGESTGPYKDFVLARNVGKRLASKRGWRLADLGLELVQRSKTVEKRPMTKINEAEMKVKTARIVESLLNEAQPLKWGRWHGASGGVAPQEHCDYAAVSEPSKGVTFMIQQICKFGQDFNLTVTWDSAPKESWIRFQQATRRGKLRAENRGNQFFANNGYGAQRPGFKTAAQAKKVAAEIWDTLM